MNDPTFNLLQLERRPNWYDHLPQVEAAMAEESRVATARHAAGWDGDEGGWVSPDGVSEYAWQMEDWPFPEDVAFASWFCAAHHDSDQPLNPYPNARPGWLAPTGSSWISPI